MYYLTLEEENYDILRVENSKKKYLVSNLDFSKLYNFLLKALIVK